MNQNPNNSGRTPRPNPNLAEEQLRARRAAAKRAYYEKKRKEKQRLRIAFGVIAVVIVAIFIGLIVLLVRGIGALIENGKDASSLDTEVGIVQGTDDTGSSEQTEGSVIPSVTDTDTTEAGSTEEIIKEAPAYEELGFSADLRDYEKYMNPKEERDDYLILVNASHALSQNDTPKDLIDVVNTRKDGRDAQKMRKVAAKALEALYIEAHAQGVMRADTPSGYPLSVTSAYRSYATQNYLFTTYTQNEMNKNPALTKAQAEAIVETYSCRPGTSEHQTGLCCDMHTLSGADVSFRNDPAFVWLADNAWKFGFILRFPEDKTDVTGISYEPWHFRYVGRYHAYKIHEGGLCLEEYVANLG